MIYLSSISYWKQRQPRKRKCFFKKTSEVSPRNSFTRLSQFVIFSFRIFLKSLSLFKGVDSNSSRFFSLSFTWFFKAPFSSCDALSSFASCSQWVYKAKQKNLIFRSSYVKYLPLKKHYFSIISPWKRAWSFICTKMNFLYPKIICAMIHCNLSSDSEDDW